MSQIQFGERDKTNCYSGNLNFHKILKIKTNIGGKMNTCKPKMTTCENQSGRVCFILYFPSTESENLPGKKPRTQLIKKPHKSLIKLFD